jgi:hypothetical protein
MEALTEASADQLDLMLNYDDNISSFREGGNKGNSSVRHVTNKELLAQHPPNAVGGGSRFLDFHDCHELKDSFTGLIDGITGELVSGIREYILTGEIYEGPFRHGLRHGNGAIVRNIYLPQNSIATGSMTSLPKTHANVVPKFYGTFYNDAPTHGTLVVPSLFTYQGPLLDLRPHGDNGILIKTTGYKYEGSFRKGLFHGTGIEIEPAGGIYKGSFANGVREGNGKYTTIMNQTGVKYCYKGQWLDNQKQGEGEEKLKRSEIYVGQFHANERHGYGSLTFEHPRSLSDSDSDSDSDGDECINRNGDEGENNRTVNTELSTKHVRNDFISTESNDSKDGVNHLPQHTFPVIAEGAYRAGYPLNGTHGWTLIYGNGDCYTGYANDYHPEGYGVMRYSNQDVYTGEWVDGKRSGEGCFISADGKEEYVGIWDHDKIVPVDEGDRIERMARLTDMALFLLEGDEFEDKTLHEFIQEGEDSYRSQRDLLESIVEKSVAKSIERMNHCNGFDDNLNWPLRTSQSKNIHRRGMNTPTITSRKLKVDVYESPKRMDDGILKTPKSATGELGDASERETFEGPAMELKTQLKAYKNGDTYLGAHCPITGLRKGYGGKS